MFEGDVVRFGRIPFKIAQLVLHQDGMDKPNANVNNVSADDLPSQRVDKPNQSLIENESSFDLNGRPVASNLNNYSAINATTFQNNDEMSFNHPFNNDDNLPAIQFSKYLSSPS